MRNIGFINAVLAGTLFGVGGSFAQFLFQHRGVDIGWLVAMRLLFAGAGLLLICAMRQGTQVMAVWRSDAKSILVFALIGMLPVQYTYMAAINTSNTATATVLQFTAPAMVALWASLTQRQIPKPHEVLAIGLAAVGTFFLATHGKMGLLSISPIALFWGIASAAAAAFNSLQPTKLLKRYGAAVIAGWGMLIGGIALSLLHPPWQVKGTWDAQAVVFFAFILTLGTLTAFYLYNSALRLIGPQLSILLTCAEPLSAAILAVWWLGVAWGTMDWLGTICIISMIALLASQQSRNTQAEKIT